MIVGLLVILLVGSAAADQDLLARVCDENSKDVPVLNDIEQVRALISSYKSSPDQCADKYAGSFHELDWLLYEEKLADVCSERTVDYIENYHLDFIHIYSPSRNTKELREFKRKPSSKKTHPIPRALYQFFVMFATQVSALCRSEVPHRLQAIVDEQHLVSDSDFEIFNEFASKTNALTEQLSSRVNRILQSRSIAVLPPPTTEVSSNVAIPVNSILSQMKETCEKRLRPIYREVMFSVARLQSLGYVDQKQDSEEVKAQIEKPHIARWYLAYQMCEALHGMSLVVIPEENCENKQKCYGFLSDEEAGHAKCTMAVEPDVEKLRSVKVAHEAIRSEMQLKNFNSQADADVTIKKFKDHVNRKVKEQTGGLFGLNLHFNERLFKSMGLKLLLKFDKKSPKSDKLFKIVTSPVHLAIVSTIRVAMLEEKLKRSWNKS